MDPVKVRARAQARPEDLGGLTLTGWIIYLKNSRHIWFHRMPPATTAAILARQIIIRRIILIDPAGTLHRVELDAASPDTKTAAINPEAAASSPSANGRPEPILNRTKQ